MKWDPFGKAVLIGSTHLYVTVKAHLNAITNLHVTIKTPECHYSFEHYINCLSFILCCALFTTALDAPCACVDCSQAVHPQSLTSTSV